MGFKDRFAPVKTKKRMKTSMALLWFTMIFALTLIHTNGEYCADYNIGAARSADAGIRETFICPRDGVALRHCREPYTRMKPRDITHKSLEWKEVVFVVPFNPSLDIKLTPAFKWWIDMIPGQTNFVLEQSPTPDVTFALANELKLVLPQLSHIEVVDTLQPIVDADRAGLYTIDTIKTIYLLKKAYTLFPTQMFYFKVDLDSMLFTRRLISFFETFITTTDAKTPLYFGTVRATPDQTNSFDHATAGGDHAVYNQNSTIDQISEENSAQLRCILLDEELEALSSIAAGGAERMTRSSQEHHHQQEYHNRDSEDDPMNSNSKSLCYADDRASYGLNNAAMTVLASTFKRAFTSSESGGDHDLKGSDNPDDLEDFTLRFVRQTTTNSVGEFIARALRATFGQYEGGAVIHCGGFGSSDLINNGAVFKQSLAFHYVDSEWLTLHDHRLRTHFGEDTLDKKRVPKHPFHSDWNRGNGDNGGLKVLIVSVDNRPLVGDIDSTLTRNGGNYYSMTSVMQHSYSKRHGYDYLRLLIDSSDLLRRVHRHYSSVNVKDTPRSSDPKYGSAVFHPGYRYFRASSWGKLPALWHVTANIGHHYDYIWYMDSDATPNPMQNDRSISDALALWQSKSEQMVVRGNKDIFGSNFIFFSNFPWRDDLPCAGSVLYKPNKSEASLREWWDFDIPHKAFNDFMEQDALWYMLLADPALGFSINTTTMTLLSEPQFPSPWHGVSDLWFTHIPNYEANRHSYFKNMLRPIDLLNAKKFLDATKRVTAHHTLYVDVFDVTEAMEKLHTKYRPRKKYPPFVMGKKEDEAFHLPTGQLKRPEYPPVGSLYNGFAVRKDGDAAVYLVFGNKRHAFNSYDMFVRMGFENDMVLVFRNWDGARPYAYMAHQDVNNIKISTPIPPEGGTFHITANYSISPLW